MNGNPCHLPERKAAAKYNNNRTMLLILSPLPERPISLQQGAGRWKRGIEMIQHPLRLPPGQPNIDRELAGKSSSQQDCYPCPILLTHIFPGFLWLKKQSLIPEVYFILTFPSDPATEG